MECKHNEDSIRLNKASLTVGKKVCEIKHCCIIHDRMLELNLGTAFGI